MVALSLIGCTEESTKQPQERYFSEWPENGTFWEVLVEQGWVND